MHKMENDPKPEVLKSVEQSTIDKNKQDLFKFFNISSKTKVAATVSGLGLVLFFISIYTVSFKNNTFNTLYPKEESQASQFQLPARPEIKSAGFILNGPQGVSVGEEFSLDVKVKTATETATIMAAQIRFDPNKLEAKVLDDTNSAAKEWIDSQINTDQGMISLVASFPKGIQLTEADQYMKITFRAKEIGPASIIIDDKNSHIYRLKDKGEIMIEYDVLPISIK